MWAYAHIGRADPRSTALDADLRSQFEALGVAVDEPSSPEPQGFPVLSENWPIVLAFLACATQWPPAVGNGFFVFSGLNYAGVDVVLRLRNFGPDLFEGIQVMEAAALPILNGGRDA